MLCHFRYVLDNLFGDVQAVSLPRAPRTSTERWDESGKPYACTADDSAYATFELEGGIIAHINASWCVRVRRDDLFVLQVDGTQGQRRGRAARLLGAALRATPRPVVESRRGQPDRLSTTAGRRFRPQQTYDNAFKVQWELFLRHVVKDEPFRWTLLEGAKGVQLAEKALESWQQRQWVDVPKLELKADET